ncbi:MAG: VanZ family protein [Bacteroidales bacterium]|nr:VanZ family protein [Bacteroidales bacterium]
MEKRKTYIVVTALFALYIVAVLCLCLLNLSDKTPELPKYLFGIPMDKIAHFVMYFAYPVVGWLLLTYNKQIKINRKYVFSTIFITGVAFAAFTETAQGLFTIYRDSDPLDMLANFLGISAACILMKLLEKPATRFCDSIQNYMHNKLYK